MNLKFLLLAAFLVFGGDAFGQTAGQGSGAGAPAIDAPIGSLYSNTSGGAATTLYVKTAAGVGGWTAK